MFSFRINDELYSCAEPDQSTVFVISSRTQLSISDECYRMTVSMFIPN